MPYPHRYSIPDRGHPGVTALLEVRGRGQWDTDIRLRVGRHRPVLSEGRVEAARLLRTWRRRGVPITREV